MDSSPVEELMEITAQSLLDLEIQDRFEVIKEIGRGKYGHVLLVTHRCKGTPMALKVMPRASTQLQGFLREYCTCLHLSGHPSIVRLFGIVFKTSEFYCFAQELVTGRDLFNVIQPKVGLPQPAVKRCAVQISSALEFVHSRGLVHRDVKPENVLLLDAACSRVKLADFGLAQRRGAYIRFVSGTLPYSAPELCERVLRPDGGVAAPPLRVEPALDSWSFGVLLFCITTGLFPWETCSHSDSFYRDWSEWGGGEEGGHGGEAGEAAPPLWTRFTPVALQMFRQLLAVDPELRSGVLQVKAFVQHDWLKQTTPLEQATPPLAPPTESSVCRRTSHSPDASASCGSLNLNSTDLNQRLCCCLNNSH